MPDQSKLAEILCRMQSDYIPEHKAAADDFLKEGFPTSVLFSIIQRFKQPNLVSMYFYICGKRSDEETLNAWHYLRQRFEATPEKFVTSSYNPWDLSDEDRYLLFSARKYLLIEGKSKTFIPYVEQIKNEAVPLMQKGTQYTSANVPVISYYLWLNNFFINAAYKASPSKDTSSIKQPQNIKAIVDDAKKLLSDSTFKEYVIKIKETYKFRTNNWLFVIGLEWEKICQDICCVRYLDVLFNNQGIRLENNSIPDVVVGNIKRNSTGKISHVTMIVECKKSVYFNGWFDALNNETTDKYINYCDLLEFWVLEKPNGFIKPDHPKVKYLFSCDLLNVDWVPEQFKKRIQSLLKALEIVEIYTQMSMIGTTDIIYSDIEQLLKFPPLPPSKSKSEKEQGPVSTIRQYSLDGTFLKEFESVQSAAAETGLRVDAITNVTSGRRNSIGGFLWKKCLAGSAIENIVPPNTALDLEGKTIFQVDQYGEVVATFDTIGQAAKTTGISRRSISDALKGIQKRAGGYTWTLGDKVLEN